MAQSVEGEGKASSPIASFFERDQLWSENGEADKWPLINNSLLIIFFKKIVTDSEAENRGQKFE